jgi:hypothetical protein
MPPSDKFSLVDLHRAMCADSSLAASVVLPTATLQLHVHCDRGGELISCAAPHPSLAEICRVSRKNPTIEFGCDSFGGYQVVIRRVSGTNVVAPSPLRAKRSATGPVPTPKLQSAPSGGKIEVDDTDDTDDDDEDALGDGGGGDSVAVRPGDDTRRVRGRDVSVTFQAWQKNPWRDCGESWTLQKKYTISRRIELRGRSAAIRTYVADKLRKLNREAAPKSETRDGWVIAFYTFTKQGCASKEALQQVFDEHTALVLKWQKTWERGEAAAQARDSKLAW